jgi:hypothetical protein
LRAAPALNIPWSIEHWHILLEQGTTLHYTLQNMAEFWNVMTRPKARNGFEFSLAEAEREIRAIESGMTPFTR